MLLLLVLTFDPHWKRVHCGVWNCFTLSCSCKLSTSSRNVKTSTYSTCRKCYVSCIYSPTSHYYCTDIHVCTSYIIIVLVYMLHVVVIKAVLLVAVKGKAGVSNSCMCVVFTVPFTVRRRYGWTTEHDAPVPAGCHWYGWGQGSRWEITES